MDLVQDPEKDEWLKSQPFISFGEIAAKIRANEYPDVIDDPSCPDRRYYILSIRGYTWVVPFVFGELDRIVLKTAFPSRKLHRKYGGGKQ